MEDFLECQWCVHCGNGVEKSEARLSMLARRRWLYSAGISLGILLFYWAATRLDAGAAFVTLATFWVCFISIVWPVTSTLKSVRKVRTLRGC
jgi:hypothetical protein